MPDATITRGLVDPLSELGFGPSAGIRTGDGRTLYALFDQHSRRVMIVARPTARGDMTAVALAPWTAARPPSSGDLLDELVDPRHLDVVRRALELLERGSL